MSLARTSRKLLQSGIDFVTNPNKVFGAPGIKRKLGLAAGYVGAGYGVSALAEHQQANSRAYYGDEYYDKHYKGADSLGGLAKGIGYFFGGMSLIDRDYISRGRNTYNYLMGKEARGYRKLLNSKKPITRTSFTDGGYTTSRVTEPFKTSSHPGVMARRAEAAAGLKSLQQRPGLGPVQIFSLAVMGGALDSGPVSKIMSAYPNAGSYAMTAVGIGAAGMIGASIHRNKAYGATMATAAGAGLGAMTALKFNNRAAEGNIVDFNTYDDSVVRRMNFSTAGLVQALHNANRRM